MKIIYPILLVALFACNENAKSHVKSFEITPEKDTVNLTDFNGLKQGKWIIDNGTSQDTVFYKDNIPQ